MNAHSPIDGIAYARQWRIDNKPYFDAIYGPEPEPTSRLRDLLSAWIELDSVLSAAYCQPGDTELLVDRIEDDRWEAAQALREYLVCDLGLNDGMLRKLGEAIA